MQHDIETAHHGGVHSCAVLTGYNTLEQLRAAQPDLIVEHLGELRRVLEQNDLHLKPAAKQFEETHPPLATVGALIFNARGRSADDPHAQMVGPLGHSRRQNQMGRDRPRPRSAAKSRRRPASTVTDIEFVLVQDCIHSKEFYRDAHFVLLNYTCRCAKGGRG